MSDSSRRAQLLNDRVEAIMRCAGLQSADASVQGEGWWVGAGFWHTHTLAQSHRGPCESSVQNGLILTGREQDGTTEGLTVFNPEGGRHHTPSDTNSQES